MNIDKMVPGCPWRSSPKIYLQVFSFFVSLSFSWLLMFFIGVLNFFLWNFWLMKVQYPVGRKYVSASSAPRLKLLSTSDLKAIFSIEDFKLPPWLDGMYVIISFWLHMRMCVDMSLCSFVFFFFFHRCMAEYLPHLEESLEKQVGCIFFIWWDSLHLKLEFFRTSYNSLLLKVLEAVSLIDVRRRFIEDLASLFGRPLEADPVCIPGIIMYCVIVWTIKTYWLVLVTFLDRSFAERQHFLLALGHLHSWYDLIFLILCLYWAHLVVR